MTWTSDSDQSWRFSIFFDHVVTFSTAPGPGVRARPDCQSSFRIGPVWVMSRWRGWEHIGHTSLSLHCGFMRFHEAICNESAIWFWVVWVVWDHWLFALRLLIICLSGIPDSASICGWSTTCVLPLDWFGTKKKSKNGASVQCYKQLVPGQGESCRRCMWKPNDVSLPFIFRQFWSPKQVRSHLGVPSAPLTCRGPKPGRSNLKNLRSPLVVPLPAVSQRDGHAATLVVYNVVCIGNIY